MRVPVLSKHIRLVMPPTIVLLGEVQNIDFYFIFYKAKIIPNVILTGRPGGTVTVTKSKNLINKSKGSACSANLITNTMYEITVTINKNNRNFTDCFSKMFLF